jgi:ankyrin repeat protein
MLLRTNNFKLFQCLLEKKANPILFADIATAYHIAAENGFAYVIKEFSSKEKPDFSIKDEKGFTIIDCALMSKSIETLSLILQFKPSVKTDQLAFAKFLCKGDTDRSDLLNLLLQTDFETNYLFKGKPLLDYFLISGKTQSFQMLFDAKKKNMIKMVLTIFYS